MKSNFSIFSRKFQNSQSFGEFQISEILANEFRQIEALIQIREMCNFRKPIPLSRKWAASPDFLLEICKVNFDFKPKLTLELGSGLSTLVASKTSAGKVISLDESKEYSSVTKNELTRNEIYNAEVRWAPVRNEFDGGDWYQKSALLDIENIDFLIVDGPSTINDPKIRLTAFEALISKLSKNCVILIDDGARNAEKELAIKFGNALTNHNLVELDCEKGAFLIFPKSSQ